MRDKLLSQFAKYHVNHPWVMLAIVVVVTLIFGVISEHLQVTMRWSDLLPSKDRRTVQFNKIIDEFVSSTSIIVVVQGEEERIKQFADELAPRLVMATDTSKNEECLAKIYKNHVKIKELTAKGGNESGIKALESEIKELKSRMNRKLIQRVDYKTEVDFLRNHGLMLIKEDDLKNMKDIFTSPNLTDLIYNINNSMEKEYVGKSESISTREKEDQAVNFLDGLNDLVQLLQQTVDNENIPQSRIIATADKLLLGEPYFLSYDKKALILNAIPNFTMMDTELLITGTDVAQAIVDDLLEDYPDVKAGLTGFVPIGHDEMVYSQQSLGYTSLIAVIAILALLIISLRMWVAPFLAMLNLLVGIVWAIGVTVIVVGQLNIMTQMMAVILLGLGIDFSIHLISTFTEARASGDTIVGAMEKAFLKSGKGIITGGLTTACAFLTMIISSSRGMKEMGIVTGSGLLAILVTTMLFLPTLLIFRERRLERKREKGKKEFKEKDISFRFLGTTGSWLGQRYVFTMIASLVITLLLLWSASKITFDQNYLNIEPEGLTSVVLQDTVMDKFDMSMDYAMVVTTDIEKSREFSKEYREMGSVAMVEDISYYLPSKEEQVERIPHINEIHQAMQSAPVNKTVQANQLPALKKETERLQMNVMEMQDMAYLGGQDKVDNKCKTIIGDPVNPQPQDKIQTLINTFENKGQDALQNLSQVQQQFAPYFKNEVINMCSTDPIHFEDLPETILDRYSNKKRDHFLLTVYPAGSVWQDAGFLQRFVKDLEKVTDQATGMPPIFSALIEIIGRDGRSAMLLTLVIVFLLLWADFRKPKYALLAMIPLAVGVFWMVGFMHLTGQQFTVMNIMGLPMILGIGIDNGVHIVHRWIREGKGHIRTIFSSTGKAIFLTSLTTMLGFGSLVFSIWRGFGHLGAALFVGVAACFLTTVIVLPGLMGLIEQRGKH